MENEESTLEEDTSTHVLNEFFTLGSSYKIDIRTRFEELSITIEHQRNTIDKLLEWLDEERDDNKEIKFELMQERDKREDLELAYRQRSDNLIKKNNIVISKIKTEIKDLKDSIVDLQELVQPRPITEEDKKRILADFFDDEE